MCVLFKSTFSNKDHIYAFLPSSHLELGPIICIFTKFIVRDKVQIYVFYYILGLGLHVCLFQDAFFVLPWIKAGYKIVVYIPVFICGKML